MAPRRWPGTPSTRSVREVAWAQRSLCFSSACVALAQAGDGPAKAAAKNHKPILHNRGITPGLPITSRKLPSHGKALQGPCQVSGNDGGISRGLALDGLEITPPTPHVIHCSMRLAAPPGPFPRPPLFPDVSSQDSGRVRRGPFFVRGAIPGRLRRGPFLFAGRSLAAQDAARLLVFRAVRGAPQAGGSEVSASPSGRCMITESVQRPSLNPAEVRTPTGRNPHLPCKFMDAVFAESPITATIWR